MDEKMVIADLNLLVIYLSGWEEESREEPGKKDFRSWKNYKYEILNQLEERELISQDHTKKPLYITEEGKRKAEELKSKYL